MSPRLKPTTAAAAERGVLGAMLLRGDIPEAVHAAALRAGDFGELPHRLIFDAAMTLAGRGIRPDAVTMMDEMETRGTLAQAGGIPAISALAGNAPMSDTVPAYIEQIRAASLRRSLLEVAAQMVESARDGDTEPAAAADTAIGLLDALVAGRPGSIRTLRHIGELVAEVQADIERREQSGDTTPGFATGLRALDSLIGGIRRKEYIVIGARPGMGKSALLLNILDSICVEQQQGALLFALEMSGEANAARLLSGRARVSGLRIRDAKLAIDDRMPMEMAAGQLSASGLWIDDDPRPSGAQIVTRSRRFGARHGAPPAVIAVDYLQLAEGSGEAEHERIASVSRDVNAMKKRLDCAVIAVCQLNRECEKRRDRRPMLSDLGGSGQIERDADVILFPFRKEVYSHASEDEGKAEIIVAKNRSGQVGTADVAWRGEMTRFENLAGKGWRM